MVSPNGARRMTARHHTGQAPLRGVPSTSAWLRENGRQREAGAVQPMRRPGLIARLLGRRG